MVKYMENNEDFKFNEVETQWNLKIDPFRSFIYSETVENAAATDNDHYGSFEFYELNTTSHRYMFSTLVNITSPHASVLYPQFMLEAILKLATDDPEFEFKVKSTPYPIQAEIDKRKFSQERQFKTQALSNYFVAIKLWEDVGISLNSIFAFAYIILSASIVSQLIQERKSRAKFTQI